MRKFTKEISALLAATAMSASVCIASAAESADQPIRMSGQATVADQDECPTTTIAPTEIPNSIGTWVYEEPTEPEFPPTAGVPMIEPTTVDPIEALTEVPDPIGTYAYVDPDEEEIPPLIGEPMPPDEAIEPTTIPSVTTLPPSIGTWVYEDPEEETTVPKGEEHIKPTLRGDADLNGLTELSDLVTVSKHVLNEEAFPLKNKVAEANADMNGDKTIDVLDVSELTEDQLGR